MKIIYIASGAANMYGGSCMHHNALAAYREMFSDRVGLDRSKIDVVWPGIALYDYRCLYSDR